MERDGPDDALHYEFAREGQDDGVEADEGEVAPAFAIVYRSLGAGSLR